MREREKERQRQRHRQREKQAPCQEPDVELDPGAPGSRPGPKAGAKPPLFSAASFTVDKSWKQPKCPSVDKWIMKMWSTYIYNGIFA